MQPASKYSTKETILSAATELFLVRGFAAVSLSEIAARAKVTQSLISHHFGSKGGLWAEVKQHLFQHYADEQMETIQEAPEESRTVFTVLSSFFGFVRDNPGYVRLMTWMYLEGDTALPESQEQLIAVAIKEIETAQKNGIHRSDLPAGFLLLAVVLMCEGWAQNRQFKKTLSLESMDDDKILNMMAGLFAHGVSPGAAQA